MKIDQTISDIIFETCEELNISKEEGLEIIQSYYASVKHIMTEREKGSIKIDLLGKFNFSFAYKKKLNSIKENKIEQEFKLKIIK